MKAIVYDRYRSPDVLELREVDKPIPNTDEVLVRVRAAGLNPALCPGPPLSHARADGPIETQTNHHPGQRHGWAGRSCRGEGQPSPLSIRTIAQSSLTASRMMLLLSSCSFLGLQRESDDKVLDRSVERCDVCHHEILHPL